MQTPRSPRSSAGYAQGRAGGHLGDEHAALALHPFPPQDAGTLSGPLQAAHGLGVLPSAPVDGTQVVAGAEQVLEEVVLPAGGDRSQSAAGMAQRAPDGAGVRTPSQACSLPSTRCRALGMQGGSSAHGRQHGGGGRPLTRLLPLGTGDLLGEEDALPEVGVAGGRLLQAVESEPQVQVESGPHFTQFSLGQRPWKVPPHSHIQGLTPTWATSSGAVQLLPHQSPGVGGQGSCHRQGTGQSRECLDRRL